MATDLEEPRCPRCGTLVPVTLTTPEPGDQLTPERVDCPGCGAHLERAVDGHADYGWRVAA